MQLNFRRVLTTDDQYQQVFDLREDVLRRPLGLSLHDEDLSAEVNDHILAATINTNVVACLILTPISEATLQLRQMAVAENVQGNQVGRRLVDFAEDYARNEQYSKIILHARMVAKGFYEKMGYKQVGSIFEEVGVPHIVMEKRLL